MQLKCLEKAVRTEANDKNVGKFEKIMKVINAKKEIGYGIVRLSDMNEYSELIEDNAAKKKLER